MNCVCVRFQDGTFISGDAMKLEAQHAAMPVRHKVTKLRLRARRDGTLSWSWDADAETVPLAVTFVIRDPSGG